jgi:ATP-dependent Clp protease adaptor protein ClpS
VTPAALARRWVFARLSGVSTSLEAVMADKDREQNVAEPGKDPGAGSTATKPKRARKRSPLRRPPQPLPPWKVLLHNDDKNTRDYVVATITQLTSLNEQDAEQRMVEADKTGLALLLTTHKERAELYQEQFTSKGLIVTIEPAE